MPYNHAQSEFGSERKAFIVVSVLFLNLILVSSQIILKNRQSLLANTVANIVTPFQIVIQKTSDFIIREFRHYVFLKNTYKRYQTLKQKFTEVKYQNHLLKTDLHRLQALLQVREQGKVKNFLLVDCISIDPNFPFHALIINHGTREGIMENMTVLNLEGELVGKTVAPISISSATVRLITSSIGGAGAYIGTSLLEGFLSGHNAPLCSFRYLMENKTVFNGDIVITSGTDLLFRPYIPIGRVVNIEKDVLIPKIWMRPFFLDKPIKQLVLLR